MSNPLPRSLEQSKASEPMIRSELINRLAMGREISDLARAHQAQDNPLDELLRQGLLAQLGEQPDPQRAYDCYKKAAQANDPEACLLLGIMLKGEMSTLQLAHRWLERAVALGSIIAKRVLALSLIELEAKPKLALEWLSEAAEAGDPIAQLHLGALYADGDLVPLDLGAAVAWYQKAADQSLPGACCLLGMCYEDGLGVEPDLNKAMALYEEAAHLGDVDAALLLAIAWDEGRTGRHDPKKAADWFEVAAKAGSSTAQVALASCYQRGDGRAQDDGRALHWLRRASRQNDPEAHFQLGLSFTHGKGVERSPHQALLHFMEAAQHNHADAHYCIALAYARGDGTEANPERARYWLQKAQQLGSQLADNLASSQSDQPLNHNQMAHVLVAAMQSPSMPFDALKSTATQVIQGAAGLLQDQLNKLIHTITQAIDQAPIDRAAVASLVVGTLVESGAAANLAAPMLFRALPKVLEHANAFKQRLHKAESEEIAQIAEIAPAEAAAWHTLELWCQPAIAVLARDAELRRRALSSPLRAQLDLLRSSNKCAAHLWKLIQAPINESVLVLAPEKGLGFELRISGISDNFQLHTLLAHALRKHASLVPNPPAAEIVAVAQGEGLQRIELREQARWGLFSWRALRSDLRLPPEPELSEHAYSAQDLPNEFETFNAKKVVLLGPSVLSERWAVSRTFGPLHASVILDRELDADEVQSWLGRLACASDRCNRAH